MSLLRTYNAVIVFVAINGVFAYSVYAVLIAGQLSLAQAGFASVAAYSSALLTMEAGWPFPLVVVVGVSAAAVTAALLGLPVLRLRGVFLAIATLGFGEMVRILMLNLDLTGGAIGLRPIPKVVTIWQAYLALAMCGWFFWRLRPTRRGLALAALRQDEIAARAMGIDIVRYRMFSFVVSGAVAGLAGVLFAHFTRFIAPDQFGFERAVDALLYAIVGGTGHWLGPALGGGFMTVLPEIQRQAGVEAGWARPFVNGLILLGVVLFLPGGLVGVGRLRRRPPARAPVRAVAPGRGAAVAAPPARAEPPAVLARAQAPLDTATETAALVRLRGVDKDYGGVKALDGVDLEVRPGEVLGLIGPNGAGKTTLVNIITGLAEASGGEVEVLSTPQRGLSADQVTRLGVSRTFQQVKLFEQLTVLENVIVGGHRVTPSTFLPRLALLPRARRQEAETARRAERFLELVGLAGRGQEPAGSMAYGDRRRLEIARALSAEPTLLVLDEPAAGMNQVEAQRLGGLISRISAQGVSVLLIEHNVRLVMSTCTRVVVLDFGRKIADGDPATVARDPQVIRAYLGGPADEREMAGAQPQEQER